jgi:hypothetical protein
VNKFIVVGLFAVVAFASSRAASSSENRDPAQDRQTLLALEDQWLHARDAAILDRILAFDFVHIAPGGYVLSKDEHIAWFEKHMPPVDRSVRLDRVRVRIYGDTGIVNGWVISTDPQSTKERRTAFTDVFVFRDGRWQAVNAQEDSVDSPH